VTQTPLTDKPALPPIDPALLTRPRRVRRRSWTSALGRWFVRLFVLPHTIAGVVVAGMVIGWPIWKVFGHVYTAQVTAAHVNTSRSKGKTHTSYVVDYAFDLPGTRRTNHTSVTPQRFRELGGDPSGRTPLEKPHYGTIQVRGVGVPSIYFYDDAVEGNSSSISTWLFMIVFATFWDGVVLALSWGLYVVPLRQRLLCRNGRVGFGVITAKYISGSKNKSHYLEYDFRTEGGLAGHGKMTVEGSDAYRNATVGENVIVLHPDGKVKPSLLYDYCNYRCVS